MEGGKCLSSILEIGESCEAEWGRLMFHDALVGCGLGDRCDFGTLKVKFFRDCEFEDIWSGICCTFFG